MQKKQARKRIVVVSSSGGHLVQMSNLLTQLSLETPLLLTTARPEQIPISIKDIPSIKLIDANHKTIVRVLILITQCLIHVIRIRPQLVISTGAAPGAIIILISKVLYGSKTIWVDSLANVERMSLSGRIVKRFSDLWLSQWPDVAKSENAKYIGQLL